MPGSSPAPLSVPCCCGTALATEGDSWNVRQLPRNEHQCLQAGAYHRRSHHEVFWRPGQRAAPSKSFSLCGGVVRGCATLVRLGLCGVVRPIWRTSSQFGSGVGSEQVPSMSQRKGFARFAWCSSLGCLIEGNLMTQTSGYGSKAPSKHRQRPCDR